MGPYYSVIMVNPLFTTTTVIHPYSRHNSFNIPNVLTPDNFLSHDPLSPHPF